MPPPPPSESSVSEEQNELIGSLVYLLNSFFTCFLTTTNLSFPSKKAGLLQRFTKSASLEGAQLMKAESNIAFGTIVWIELFCMAVSSKISESEAHEIMGNINSYIKLAIQSYNKNIKPEDVSLFVLKRSMIYSEVVAEGADADWPTDEESQVKAKILFALYSALSKTDREKIEESILKKIIIIEKPVSEAIHNWLIDNWSALKKPVF